MLPNLNNNETAKSDLSKITSQTFLWLAFLFLLILIISFYFLLDSRLRAVDNEITGKIENVNNQMTSSGPEKDYKQNFVDKFDLGQDLPIKFDYPSTFSQKVASDHKSVDFWRGEQMMFTVKHMPKDKIKIMLEDKKMGREIIGKVGPDECIDNTCGYFDAYLYREPEVNCGQVNCPTNHRVYLVDNTEGIVFIFYDEYDISLMIKEIVSSAIFLR